MDWRDLVAGWDQDPEFQEVYRQTYPYHAVADAVVELRAAAGLTQADLADKAGTTQSVIARLESGRHPVRLELINRIADALDMNWRPVFEVKRSKSSKVTNVPAVALSVDYTYEIESFHWTSAGAPIARHHLASRPLQIAPGTMSLERCEPMARGSRAIWLTAYDADISIFKGRATTPLISAPKKQSQRVSRKRQPTLAMAG